MTSEKKAQANRENALKSTGPKTPEGKAAVGRNALRHGLLSREVLLPGLPGEDGDILRELSEHLRAELQPVGEFENRLVDRIISSFWRLRRLVRVEAGIFVWERLEERAERAEREAGEYEKMEVVGGLFTQEPKPVITDEEKHEEALSRARRMRSEQEDEIATLGRTFARDAKTDAFSKLSRYETAIERSIYKAWHELQRLQAARRADGDAPPPVAMDLFVSGVSRDVH